VLQLRWSSEVFTEQWRRRYAEQLERVERLDTAVTDGCLTVRDRRGRPRLPQVRHVLDPISLGVHPSPLPAGGADAGLSPVVPTYVRRDRDADLHEAVERGGFILIVGDSAAGKSRAAYEAVVAVRSEDELVVPDGRSGLPAALARVRQAGRYVVWLDDLERFLGPGGGLTRQMVAELRIADRGDDVVLLATLRAEERVRVQGDDSEAGAGVGPASREARDVLELATEIRLERRFSAAERGRAAEQVPRDPRIAAALFHADTYGLAEYLSAGPKLLARWQDGWAPGAGRARGAALVAVAVDCRRAGLRRPVPHELLVRLHERYLDARGGVRLRPESLDAAFDWITRVDPATAALLHSTANNSYEVFDYLVDSMQHKGYFGDRVPAATLRILLDHTDVGEALAIADLALVYGWNDVAEAAVLAGLSDAERLGPTHPDTLAACHYLAFLMTGRGDLGRAEAEFWNVLKLRTDVLGAEHPDTLASRHELARVARERGDYVEAEAEFRAVLAITNRIRGPKHPGTLTHLDPMPLSLS